MYVLRIDYLIMSLAPTLIRLFIGRLMVGVARSSYSIDNAYVADISDDSNRAQNFGLISQCHRIMSLRPSKKLSSAW